MLGCKFGNELLDGGVFWNSSSGFFKICSYVICFVTLEMAAASTVIGSERKLLQGRTCKDFFEIYL